MFLQKFQAKQCRKCVTFENIVKIAELWGSSPPFDLHLSTAFGRVFSPVLHVIIPTYW